MPFTLRILCLTLLLTLSGCGGSGSGSGSGSGGSTGAAPIPAPAPTPEPEPEPSGLFSLTGSAHIASNLYTDGDTNNPDSRQRVNNSLSSAQAVSNPVTLGGFVAVPSAAEPGAIDLSGDLDDYFRVDLLAGQTVTLLVADFTVADADLYLFDQSGEIVDLSIESGQIEAVVAPADGSYFINIYAFSGATNYILAIGSNVLPQSSRARAATAAVIPWQAIVKERASANDDTSYRNQRLGMRGRSAAGKRLGLVQLDAAAATTTQRAHRLGLADTRAKAIRDPDLRARWETLMTVKALRDDPSVELAEANYRVHALAIPNDPAYASQWHYPLINLPAAWDITTGDSDVTVAVIDTGILSRHPDLIGQLVTGYDFIADTSRARDGNGIDPDPEDVGNGDSPATASYHGTHVSGTIAAHSDNRIGVAGVAWQARIMPLRVLGADGGSSYDVDQAIRYAAGMANDSGTVPAKPADIINLSLGGPGFSSSSQALINQVRQRGITIVAAAGNDGSDQLGYPAAYAGVIAVSAVDAQRNAAPYSNYGPDVDIAAPGGNNGIDITGDGYPDGVLSTGGEGGSSGFSYTFLSGTSMASPHVAGVLALMKSVNPTLSPADIDALLSRGVLSDDLGTQGRDNRYGHGLINARAAVVAALEASGNNPSDSPGLIASSTQLNFGNSFDALDLVLQNSGQGELAIDNIRSSEPWLEISATSVDAEGLGTYKVKVLREALSSGLYRGQITARSSVNSVTIDVLVAVVDASSGGDIGPVYLLLLEAGSEELISQAVATAEDSYQYRFDNVSAGDYQLVAGTDADNDLLICDPGEACGAFLTLDQPVQLRLERNRDSLDFPLEYRISIPSAQAQGEDTIPTNPDIRGWQRGQPQQPRLRKIP